jgi:hypothetical protein
MTLPSMTRPPCLTNLCHSEKQDSLIFGNREIAMIPRMQSGAFVDSHQTNTGVHFEWLRRRAREETTARFARRR